MIIRAPVVERLGDSVRVSARIESAGRKFSDPLWFRFPAGAKPRAQPEPFLVALVLVAMQLGEEIEVEGEISRKLHEGLKKYQAVFHAWFPERFKVVAIRPRGYRPFERTDEPARGRAAAFSGGVDSFYSFLSLRKELTDVVFMAGFDMPLNLTRSITELRDSFTLMMREAGVGYIAGSTNVRAFVNTVDWTNAHGSALAATALFFEHRWSRFYVPASYTSESYPRWGTHPELDSLLSTERLEFVHHGAEANRVRKLELIARAPESYSRLRVCWIQDIGLRNCGRCEKCIRTMTALEIIGALDKYATFTGRPAILRLSHRTHQSRLFALELLREAWRRGKLGVGARIALSLLLREGRRRWRKPKGAPHLLAAVKSLHRR